MPNPLIHLKSKIGKRFTSFVNLTGLPYRQDKHRKFTEEGRTLNTPEHVSILYPTHALGECHKVWQLLRWLLVLRWVLDSYAHEGQCKRGPRVIGEIESSCGVRRPVSTSLCWAKVDSDCSITVWQDLDYHRYRDTSRPAFSSLGLVRYANNIHSLHTDLCGADRPNIQT